MQRTMYDKHTSYRFWLTEPLVNRLERFPVSICCGYLAIHPSNRSLLPQISLDRILFIRYATVQWFRPARRSSIQGCCYRKRKTQAPTPGKCDKSGGHHFEHVYFSPPVFLALSGALKCRTQGFYCPCAQGALNLWSRSSCYSLLVVVGPAIRNYWTKYFSCSLLTSGQ